MISAPTENERTVTGMADMMNFPKRWEDFLHDYEFEDSRRVYTNGSRLIPSFRVKQMMEHYALRPVSREQVERMFPGCDFCNMADFGEFGFEITKHYAKICCALGSWRFPGKEQFLFCPKCGKPLTDEAVEMVIERMEKIK